MNDAKKHWENKIETEMPVIKAILDSLGYVLDDNQPNLIGEKFLMKTQKFTLFGQSKQSQKKVIIKISKDKEGKKEIESEKRKATAILKLSFTTDFLKLPEEFFYGQVSEYLIYIMEFLEQDKPLMSLPIDEQFFIALRAFDILEQIYISTYEHKQEVLGNFKILTADDYLKIFREYRGEINSILNEPEIYNLLSNSINLFKENLSAVRTYENYLVHEDFVQQNFRIKNNLLYFIDYEALQFGNLFETHARFLNFMIIHSPELERKLDEHFKQKSLDNKDQSYLSLQMLRMFKCTQLIRYYARGLQLSKDNEYLLCKKRLEFWLMILEHLLDGNKPSAEIVESYKKERDALRSPEEIHRQKMIKHLAT